MTGSNEQPAWSPVGGLQSGGVVRPRPIDRLSVCIRGSIRTPEYAVLAVHSSARPMDPGGNQKMLGLLSQTRRYIWPGALVPIRSKSLTTFGAVRLATVGTCSRLTPSGTGVSQLT